jgi:hypothetical protein
MKQLAVHQATGSAGRKLGAVDVETNGKWSMVHPASYPMGTRGSFPVDKAAEAGSRSPHLVLRSKNEWSYTSSPQYAFMAWCSVKKAQGQIYLLHYIDCPRIRID